MIYSTTTNSLKDVPSYSWPDLKSHACTNAETRSKPAHRMSDSNGIEQQKKKMRIRRKGSVLPASTLEADSIRIVKAYKDALCLGASKNFSPSSFLLRPYRSNSMGSTSSEEEGSFNGDYDVNDVNNDQFNNYGFEDNDNLDLMSDFAKDWTHNDTEVGRENEGLDIGRRTDNCTSPFEAVDEENEEEDWPESLMQLMTEYFPDKK